MRRSIGCLSHTPFPSSPTAAAAVSLVRLSICRLFRVDMAAGSNDGWRKGGPG